MLGKVTLNVLRGPAKGRSFEFEEHDTFIVGRKNDCHAQLPRDGYISRHQFILEVNPPDARLRDLGSRNGTYVNGIKYGGRAIDESPEQVCDREYPQVDLKHGNTIVVGNTAIRVSVEVPVLCEGCGVEVSRHAGDSLALGSLAWCDACNRQSSTAPQTPTLVEKTPAPACQECGKDVAEEIGTGRRGDYVCKSCRDRMASDPAQLLQKLIHQAAKQLNGTDVPSIHGYVMAEKLGQGGMGAVYRARRTRDGQEVAVKVMLSQIAVDKASRETFLREIEIIKSLSHANVVRFDDTGAIGGAFYFIMELCNGGSLAEHVKVQGPMSLNVAAPLMVQTLAGLAYTHQRNLVHRDLKPENILIHQASGQLVAKVSDFGLAKNFQKAGLSGMTATGSYAGTYPYMPREQLTNFKYIDPASDVFSIGATFYTILSGKWPRNFTPGTDPMEVILNGKAVPLRKRVRTVPTKIAAIIDRSLSLNVEDRFPTAVQMAHAMRQAFSEEGLI